MFSWRHGPIPELILRESFPYAPFCKPKQHLGEHQPRGNQQKGKNDSLRTIPDERRLVLIVANSDPVRQPLKDDSFGEF
jgi:hypothetical protein